jgi:hypothetical protein
MLDGPAQALDDAWLYSSDDMIDYAEVNLHEIDHHDRATENGPPSGHRMKSGTGPESKRESPDPFDCYPFQTYSISCARLRMLGFMSISVPDLVRVGNIIENFLEHHAIPLSPRNRAARRRKPNAFHWIDENWTRIPWLLFDRAITAVLTKTETRRKRQ